MIGIYVRQSVDKKDSISIELQIETCRRKLKPEEDEQAEIFEDKGFSGKSTANRPEFQQMIKLVREGQISKIIVYKVDRISRSMFDFLNIREEFIKYGVEFVSCKEDFDTSTATGKMMLNLLIMFAEMERETIQKRITDNYYSRGEKGFYLGGYAPFGYKKVEVYIDGKKTYKFEVIEEEAEIIRYLYDSYANKNKSLGEIVRELNKMSIPTRKKAKWNSSTISRLLSNPAYVKANADIYTFLKLKGAKLNDSVTDYIGKNGCIVYGKSQERTSLKFKNYETDYVTLGLHEGIVNPDLWLVVQHKFSEQKGHSNLGTGNLTWLQGLVKCDCCNYSCYVKRFKRKNGEFKYFYCRGKKQGTCNASTKMLRVDFLEEIAEQEIIKQLKSLQEIKIQNKKHENPEINRLKMEMYYIETQIENLISQIARGSEVTIKYINEAIESLDKKKTEVLNSVCRLELKTGKKEQSDFDIDELLKNWGNFEIEIKKKVAMDLIEEIRINGSEININFY